MLLADRERTDRRLALKRCGRCDEGFNNCVFIALKGFWTCESHKFLRCTKACRRSFMAELNAW